MAGVILCMALSVPCRAERLTRSDYRDLWNITTTSPAKQYRIDFTGDLAYAARLPVEVFDSTDKAMAYRQFGDATVPVHSENVQIVCTSVDPDNGKATRWHCATPSRAVSTIAIGLHVSTDGSAAFLTATVRSGDTAIASLDDEVHILSMRRMNADGRVSALEQFGGVDRSVALDERRSLQAVDIELSAPASRVSVTLDSGTLIDETYAKHVKWRPAELVGNLGNQLFTFSNPYPDLPQTAGRLTFATPVDPELALTAIDCKTRDCDEYTSDLQSRVARVFEVTDSSPTYFTSMKGAYHLLQFGKPLATPPKLDVAYMDTGIIFFAQGAPPYTLAVQPKDARFNAYVQGRTAMLPLEQDEHQFDAVSVSRYASGSRLVDEATKWFGPIFTVLMLIAGFAWASASRRSSAA
ncbi:MAG TPA: hypothetical protein VH082_13590 [Rudaea sp.]|nr:hypothetical protein [Rudaea sp.]